MLLVQCPRTLQVDLAQLRGFAAAVDAAPSAPRQIAFEFRHAAAVADEAVRAFLQGRGWCLVVHPNAIGRATVGSSAGGRDGRADRYELGALPDEPPVGASWAYVRPARCMRRLGSAMARYPDLLGLNL